jgi:N-methylhydantoinase A/oxoprolinase/acetone carboxylase beta subunit
MHPHRHQAGRGRHLAHQPTGIIGRKGGENLQLGVERIGLGARRVRSLALRLLREFERFSTTVANAFIAPLAERYLGAFGRCIAEGCAISAPVLLMLSSGGLAPLDVARRQPISLLESGPAAGALAAAWSSWLDGTRGPAPAVALIP